MGKITYEKGCFSWFIRYNGGENGGFHQELGGVIMPREKLPEIVADWYGFQEVTSIQKQDNAFRFRVQAEGKVYTFTVTFPKLGGVRITEKEGYFPCDDVNSISYSGKKALKLTAGNQVALFRRDAEKVFVLDVLNDKGETVFTFDGTSVFVGLGGNKVKKKKKMKYVIDFGRDEMLYGLGERFNGVNQVGKQSLLWNVDTGYNDADLDQDCGLSYRNIPILHSTKGYTIFFNTMAGAKVDCGVAEPGKCVFDFYGTDNDLFVFTGTPKENLFSYTELTGHTIIPPKWAFGYWAGGTWQMWFWEGKDYPETVQEYLDGYKKIGTPLAAFFGEGEPSIFEDGCRIVKEGGTRMLRWLGADVSLAGVKKVLGTDDPNELPMPKVKKNGKWVPIESGTLDCSHPRAYEFMKKNYSEPFQWGVKGSMVDFGERIPAESVCYNGKTGYEFHQENTLWYNKIIRDVFTEAMGDDHILFSRTGCPGSQKYVGQFGGDERSSYNGFCQVVYGGVNDGACGFNIWGSDIGGFKGDPGFELYLHWLQFGTFSPLMRAHGYGRPRNPWEYGDEAVETFKRYYWWRENMLDHVYSMAIEGNKTAAPMMRAMAVEFPDDQAKFAEQQYMFGSEMLVAPVMIAQQQYKVVHFPAGNWYSLWTGEKVAGGRRLTVDAPYTEMPVYLRAGAAMVLTLPEDTLLPRTSMLDKDKVQALLVTPADADREVRHWVDKDTVVTFAVSKTENGFTVENKDGYDLKAVLVYGAKAEKVLVDGKETAFTIDGEKVTVRTPKGFKKLEVY